MISRSRPPVQTYIQDSMYGSTVPDPFHQEELASQLKREMLLISLAGPMTNIVLAATFFILGMSGLADGEVWALVGLPVILIALPVYYIGSAEGHEYPNLQVGDEVNPRPFFALTHIDQPLLLLK